MANWEMAGKTVLITGATDGIGKQAAKELAQMGAHTVLVGRSKNRSEQIVQEVVDFSGNKNVDFFVADLLSMAEVKALADDFRSEYSRLDVLVNNAGAGFVRRKFSVDGYERTFALNHLAYFLLTQLLLDLLIENAPSRIINTSSGSHYNGKIHLDDIHLKRSYFVTKAYSQSKLANVMFTYALARRLEGSRVTVNCFHPGLVKTGIFRKVPFWGPLVDKIITWNALSLEEGAETLVYLASSEDVSAESGNYYFKKEIRTTAEISYDVELQEELWKLSEDLLVQWL